MKGFQIGRGQLLRALPRHVSFALLLGALGGALIYWLQLIQLPGAWRYLPLFPLAAVYTNAAVLPVVIPGRHWSFGFIAAMMLVLLLLAGVIVSPKIIFQHSTAAGSAAILSKVQTATTLAILTGGCLGLFYGLLAGRRGALAAGIAMGAATGYLLGIFSAAAVSSEPGAFDTFIYAGALHFAWQGALANGVLHLGAGLGAVFGAGTGKPGKPAKPV